MLLAALGLAGAGTAGCASTVADAPAPAFRVPTPPPMQGGRPGSAGAANTFLSDWVHSLGWLSHGTSRTTLTRPCHDDGGCLALVRIAADLPRDEDDYFAHWAVDWTDQIRPDPRHADSWSVVVRPYWSARDTPFHGHDGWATRTLIRVRLKLVGDDPEHDWRLWLTRVPTGQRAPGSVPLSDPVIGDI